MTTENLKPIYKGILDIIKAHWDLTTDGVAKHIKSDLEWIDYCAKFRSDREMKDHIKNVLTALMKKGLATREKDDVTDLYHWNAIENPVTSEDLDAEVDDLDDEAEDQAEVAERNQAEPVEDYEPEPDSDAYALEDAWLNDLLEDPIECSIPPALAYRYSRICKALSDHRAVKLELRTELDAMSVYFEAIA